MHNVIEAIKRSVPLDARILFQYVIEITAILRSYLSRFRWRYGVEKWKMRALSQIVCFIRLSFLQIVFLRMFSILSSEDLFAIFYKAYFLAVEQILFIFFYRTIFVRHW